MLDAKIADRLSGLVLCPPHSEFFFSADLLNSTTLGEPRLTAELSEQAGDGVVHFRRLFSFIPPVFYKAEGTRPLSLARPIVSAERLSTKPHNTARTALQPKSLADLWSLRPPG